MFSGLDFTPSPELGNHQSKLLRCVGRPALSLFYFYRYRSSQIVKSIIAYFKKGRKPFRASPDSSPALKCGVFSGGFIKVKHYYRQIEDICIDEISGGILFFDPDNGLEVKSARRDDRRYLYYRDIRKFILYADILVYQHFPRVPRRLYIEKLTGAISREIKCSSIFHFPESMVDFILIKR